MTGAPPPLPRFGPSGSSPATVLDDLTQATMAVRAAFYAVRQTYPNARDYDSRDFPRAEAAHAARLASLEQMLADLDALARHASDHLP